ncbi:DNA-3-methyladenine glycosylase family protein [Nitrospira lenta]|uniref:DNA-3-methyladenine glycosylase II n=1 Tax=Nitrospira lenta TaxID=1436998 RepID=A0A330L5Q3_9BACT|nr:DNA-3-methyladenine glycosylase [Nitrospira lenta]SPP64502.1 DNA-3-methyladenine glycosylase 1 [Nitrospira lenta]
MKDSQQTRHLAKVDPVMGRLIRDVGPFSLLPKVRRTPFESLVRAIAFQQLHEKAAESILKRFIALFPGRRFPRPAELLAVHVDAIRGAGFSGAKVLALRDLAAKTLDGTVPTGRAIKMLDDDAIVERLVAVRGIGRWTVEMLLIFQLGRPDVLPVDDFGVRNGFRIAYRRRTMPTPKEVLRYGERWKPYRTAAAWYLWRAADRAKQETTVL